MNPVLPNSPKRTTRVTVIDVDLGDTVENIMGDQLRVITQKNADQINEIINTNRQLDELKARKQAEREDAEKRGEDAMTTIYNEMLALSKRGSYLENARILTMGDFKNMISFSGRMGSWLKRRGNEYRMVKKGGKRPGYSLEPYNLPSQDSPA